MLRDLRRLPSEKDRQRKAKKRGGFLDPKLDRKHIKNINKTHTCFWCRKPLSFHHYDRIKGKIIVSCKTDGCIGNAEEDKKSWDRKYKNLYARKIDRKLCFDLKKMMYGRDHNKLWATPKRHF